MITSILFFLLVGLIPALVIGLISYNSGANSIKDEAYDKLDAVQKVTIVPSGSVSIQ